MRKIVREYGSGDQREDWTSYLMGVMVLTTILIPICGGLIGLGGSGEEVDVRRKSTVFVSCWKSDSYVSNAETPVGITVYESKIPWIIEKTKCQYPKDLEELWNRKEVDASKVMSTLPDGMSVSWYRYTIRETENSTQTAIDEVMLSDENRLVILDFGGGTDGKGVEEAIEKFLKSSVTGENEK